MKIQRGFDEDRSLAVMKSLVNVLMKQVLGLVTQDSSLIIPH